MSAAAEVAIILFVFFLIGIIVGIIAVIAIPARRPTRRLAARTGQDRPRLRRPYHRQAGPGNYESASLRGKGVAERSLPVPSSQENQLVRVRGSGVWVIGSPVL